MERDELPPKYREYLDRISGATERARQEITGTTPEKLEMRRAFVTMLKDLKYIESPPDEQGVTAIMNTDYFASFVAYHLVRCGWRPHSEKRIIKPRKVPGPGVAVDAVEWVGMDTPDDPLTGLADMSMAEVAALPEVWKHEAIRRLGGNVKSDLPQPKSGWQVDTRINITQAPRDPNQIWK